MKKLKLLSVLLSAFAFIFFCAGTVAFADETNVFDYEINADGTATITGFKANDINIVIPETVDTIKVTAIGNYAFSEMERIEKVIISAGVTAIGDEAFYGCTSLTTVEIPDTVTRIGEYAFGNCPLLEGVRIPESVDMVSDNIFAEYDDIEDNISSLSSGTVSSTDKESAEDDHISKIVMITLVLIFAVTACGICIALFIKSKRNKG